MLRAASAPVVALFGAYAKRAFHDLFGIDPGAPMAGRVISSVFSVVLQLPEAFRNDS